MNKLQTATLFIALFSVGCSGPPDGNTTSFVKDSLTLSPSKNGKRVDSDQIEEPSFSKDITRNDDPYILKITCHELLANAPYPEISTYKIIGSNLFREFLGSEKLLSTTGMMLKLSSTEDDEGRMDSLVTQVLNGKVLTRTVYYKRNGGPIEVGFSERYDFENQTVHDLSDGTETCHHNGK